MRDRKGEYEAQALKKLKHFMKKYGHFYSEDAREYIYDNFITQLYDPTAADILMQIYATIGCETKKGTFYNAHLERINKMYGLDRNILEIAGGKIPAFANKVATLQQQTKKGTITVYDPDLIITKPDFKNLTLCKEDFSKEHDIKSYDLVIGLLPCEATEAIITAACNAQKDFYVAMCGCSHFAYDPFFSSYPAYMYREYVIQLAETMLKETDNGELIIDYLPDEYDVEYPILYNRKK